MRYLISTLFHDGDGAVTVDFVVLTAAICLLGLSVVMAFSGGATDLSNEIETTLLNMDAG